MRKLKHIDVDECFETNILINIFGNKDVELKPSFSNLLKCLAIYDTVNFNDDLMIMMIR